MAPSIGAESPELSVIVPVFNEADNVPLLLPRLAAAIEGHVTSFEVIFVDDGSSDATMDSIRTLRARDPRVRAVSFSRNFGKEVAIAAGLDHARGQCAVIIDADLQHPPETIVTFLDYWRQGYKNVYGQRVDRTGDSRLRQGLTHKFYQIFGSFGEVRLPEGAGDYRLLDRQVIDALKRMPERARFSKGLYAWVGFKSIGVPFQVEDRAHGQSKFSYRKLTRFAFDGLTSFSTLPLKVWTYIGTIISAIAIISAIQIIVTTLITGIDVPGYASLMVSVMFFAGVQMLSLGVLGEYIGRIFAEVKHRPLYLVAETVGLDEDAAAAPVAEPMRRAG